MYQIPNDVMQTEQVEIMMPPYTVYGEVALGMFHRLTDMINMANEHILVRHAQICDESGKVVRSFESVFVVRKKIAAIGQREASSLDRFPGMYVPKAPYPIVVTTDSLEVRGNIFLLDGVDLDSFFLSPEPHFLPLTNAHSRSLSAGGQEEAYDLLLLSRAHVSLFSLVPAAEETEPSAPAEAPAPVSA